MLRHLSLSLNVEICENLMGQSLYLPNLKTFHFGLERDTFIIPQISLIRAEWFKFPALTGFQFADHRGPVLYNNRLSEIISTRLSHIFIFEWSLVTLSAPLDIPTLRFLHIDLRGVSPGESGISRLNQFVILKPVVEISVAPSTLFLPRPRTPKETVSSKHLGPLFDSLSIPDIAPGLKSLYISLSKKHLWPELHGEVTREWWKHYAGEMGNKGIKIYGVFSEPIKYAPILEVIEGSPSVVKGSNRTSVF